MDSPKPALDLEKELTCSICTELLYQPLTLLDCLHTFCGACLKDWFAFQADAARDAPTPPPPGTPIFTCPACRAAVRDTRHNATVATLLDMYLGANPDKGRTEAEKREVAERYGRGDEVLPRINTDKSPEQLRAEEEDRRIMEEVRMLSLSEVGVDSGLSPYRAGRRGADTSRSRDGSSDTRDSRRTRADVSRHPTDSSRSGDEQHRRRRPRHRSESQSRQGTRPEDSSAESRNRTRQVEHQSSLRSLIGTANMSERDIEREIEEFARQIQEEGILDGLDLDNIDLMRDDDLSRRITEAYRRRQRERDRDRDRQEGAARRYTASDSGGGGSVSEVNLPGATAQLRRDARATDRRRNSTGAHVAQSEDGRAPNSSRTPLLEVQPDERRRRRRTASSGRSSTAPIPPSPRGTPAVAARSHTDLALQTRHVDPSNPRFALGENRTSSSPTVAVLNQGSSQGSNLSFASRVPLQIQAHVNASAIAQAQVQAVSSSEPSPNLAPRSHRPADLSPNHSAHSSPLPSPASSTITTMGRKRTPPVLFTEPSISCDRCAKPHIEYTLHYNCALCQEGNFNICLDCYRSARGCLHWFGFGYGAFKRWEQRRRDNPSLAPHHTLVPHRYLPPQSPPAKTDSGGSGGARAQTAEDPVLRLQTGTFCDGCFAWTNTCWWRCTDCNEGDWGFCYACVNRGRCCTHPLLPQSHQPSSSPGRKSPPASPRPPNLPRRAAPLPSSLGDFRALVFVTLCEICQEGILPTQSRYHCFECTSTLERDSLPGEHEICVSCYSGLVTRGQISPENGPGGWRRCLAGHRMAVLAFEERSEGHYRYTVQDVVGGRRLRVEEVEGSTSVAKWSWNQDGQAMARLVTADVSKTAGAAQGDGEAEGVYTHQFPPGGGTGRRAVAKYRWLRQGEEAKGELFFPKNAEITEVEDVNGDWFEGSYMGEVGCFPAPYVELL